MREMAFRPIHPNAQTRQASRLNMDRRGLSVTIVALLLAVLMTSSTTAAPGFETGIMQSPGSVDGQPDAENNTMYLFGNPQLTNCFSKFNNTDAESSSYGEDSQGSGAMDIKITCRMDPVLDDNIALTEGEMINVRFALNLGGAWTNGQDGCNGDCENLNISILKANNAVAIKEFDSLNDGENFINWDIPVEEDLVYWNGSTENMGVEFTMKLKAVEGGLIVLGGEDALFGLYFSHADNSAEYNASVTFPILSQTAFDDITGGGGGGGGDDDSGMLPGFTALIGVGGLAAAALLRPKTDEE
jgi:hypothetical protein